MDTAKYTFKALESKYGHFLAPAFDITIGSKKIESAKIPISDLSVDINAGKSAGGVSLTISGMYSAGLSRWQNDLLNTIHIGARLEVEAGYINKKRIFFGYVDEYGVLYKEGDPPAITVTGIDAKGFLMSSQITSYMNKKQAPAIVKEILNDCVSKGYAGKLKVGTLPEHNVQLIQEDTDNNAFLTRLAAAFGVRFFVVNGEIIYDDVLSNATPIIGLKIGESLLSFDKRVSLKSQLGKVTVYSTDPKTGDPISGEATKTSGSGTGKTAVEFASGFQSSYLEIQNAMVTTPEECARLAQNIFDERALDFISGSGRCVGIPEIIPGRFIEVGGMDDRTDGEYFIESVRHHFSSDNGYFTEFSVKGCKTK